MGKGNKERIIPISVRCARLLNKYLLKERKSGSPYVFVTNQADKFTPSSLHKLFVRLGKKAKIDGVHPHKFRHTFALSALRNGLDPLTLQRLLGHTILIMIIITST
jgi:site-specific recombinase XerD